MRINEGENLQFEKRKDRRKTKDLWINKDEKKRREKNAILKYNEMRMQIICHYCHLCPSPWVNLWSGGQNKFQLSNHFG